jgi:hypothetical protein
MPQTIACPHCSQALTVPDDASGKPMRCPRCQKPFAVRFAALAAVPQICPSCKAQSPPGSRACLRCGQPLVVAPVPIPAPIAPVPVPVSVTPSPTVAPAVADHSAGAPAWVWLIPAVLLVAALGGLLIRDWSLPPPLPEVVEESEVVEEAPVDPKPRLALKFTTPVMKFGLTTVADHKKLTYSDEGSSNSTSVRIDEHPYQFGLFAGAPPDGEKGDNKDAGSLPGRWKESSASLGNDKLGRQREGRRSSGLFFRSKVLVTQTVEILPNQTPGEDGKRPLDTCLVRYRIENQDSQPHKVGLCFQLDTYIGSNDGVPFSIPGKTATLCTTQADFREQATIPDFVEALENADLAKPGTVAHLTIRAGRGLEPPSRVALTHWAGQSPVDTVDGEDRVRNYDIPMADIGGDSAAVLYWADKDLPPGQSRDVGFAYGLGKVAASEGGKLGVTTGGDLVVDGEFTIIAYVTEPAAGETVSLLLPDGLVRTAGAETQNVPPVEAGAAARHSLVAWKVRAKRAGKFSLRVESSTKVRKAQTVTIRKPGQIFD